MSLDGEAVGWATRWHGGIAARIGRDPRAFLGRRATVAYSSVSAGGELREARLLKLGD